MKRKKYLIDLPFITGNGNKASEINDILHQYGINIIQKNLSIDEIQSDDIREVAKKKISGIPASMDFAIIEDSGIFINALNGFPGVYSSYIYNTIGLNGILKLMANIENRNAYFISIITLKFDKKIILFEGMVKGRIGEKIKGNNNFGYDPIFIPDGNDKSYAELSLHEKSMTSHRKIAAEKLGEYIKENIDKILKKVNNKDKTCVQQLG
ncbi:MAG: XTP/dITP diphosphatase [Candidatus Thermoplasmatota archaeon]|jgi:XTP/dITP diphosphohydrolase|nr:XTP/dITP diphosphatase [Candidatus Thermoplasmatota archaeon]MCL5963584.1 XTP/dITP diphosphatase [Candidatus Thermoplasmatota archaeon]